jgi:hypothetical protein
MHKAACYCLLGFATGSWGRAKEEKMKGQGISELDLFFHTKERYL